MNTIERKNVPTRLFLAIGLTVVLLGQMFTPSASASVTGLIAFSTTQSDGLSANISIMNWDGTNQRQLTFGPVEDYGAVWSPDGTRIAFTRTFVGDFENREVYVMNSDGSGITNLTNRQGLDAFPSWSPDGKSLIFTSDRDGNREIYRIDLQTGVTTRLTTTINLDENRPKYSPDGTKIAYLQGVSDVYISDSSGGNPFRLTQDGVQKANFSWSPDGTKIVFNEDGGGFSGIFVINSDGTNQVQLTNNSETKYFDNTPSWSPDGSKIIFDSYRAFNSDIYTMNLNGSSSSQLTFSGVSSGANWSRASIISCQRGKVTTEVIAVNPKCPKGYKKK